MLPPSARHTFPDRDQKVLARPKSVVQVGIFTEMVEIPLARVSSFQESEREIQEFVVLRSPVVEVQVIATTWRFWFFK